MKKKIHERGKDGIRKDWIEKDSYEKIKMIKDSIVNDKQRRCFKRF